MKNVTRSVRNVILIALVVVNIGCDQITKTVARDQIEYGERIPVITDYFTLMKVENTGAFLSLGDNMPEILRLLLLVILPALFLVGMVVYILWNKKVSFHTAIAISFIAGGGIGNLYDRILYNSVTDFLHMDFVLFETGIFNLADVSIMVGTFWLLLTNLPFLSRKNEEAKTA